jgi:hypothetical protein
MAGPSKTSPRGEVVLTNEERRKKLGISKKQDEQWQQFAAMPQREFNRAIGTETMPSTKDILRQAAEARAPPDRPMVAAEALVAMTHDTSQKPNGPRLEDALTAAPPRRGP